MVEQRSGTYGPALVRSVSTLPLFHSGDHRFDDFNLNGVPDRLELQAWLLRLLIQFGVQVVFSSQGHSYDRLGPVQGGHFSVPGGGGYTLSMP